MQRKSMDDIVAVQAQSPAEADPKSRNGVPLLAVNPESPRVTSELVQQLREELL